MGCGDGGEVQVGYTNSVQSDRLAPLFQVITL